MSVNATLDTRIAQVVLWGPELIQIYNDAYRVLLKDRHPVALGQPTQLCWPEVWDFNEPCYRRALDHGEPTFVEDQAYLLNVNEVFQPHFFSVSYAPLRCEDGSNGGVLVTVVNSTDRETVRAIFETSYQFQGFMTPEGVLLDANKVSLASIGCDLADVVGQRFWDTPWFAATPGLPEQIQDAVRQSASGQIVRQEIDVLLPGGRRTFKFMMRPLSNQSGSIIALIVEAADLTEQRATEAQLRQLHKMEAVGQLTGGMAHDFNNHLQVITNNLRLIARYAPGNELVQQRVEGAQGAVQRGARLVAQLLAFGRRQALDPKVLNVDRFMQEAQDMLRHAVGDAVGLRTRIPEDLWTPYIDPGQLQNALLNLALNSRDAMEGRGTLTIEGRNVSLDQSQCAGRAEAQPGEYVTLAVSDTGTGMRPEVTGQIFEPFFSTKPSGSGSGLGLSMVYGFVKQSGGHVEVFSDFGHGTTIVLYLPRAPDNPQRVGTTAAVEGVGPVETRAVAGGTETILVAEDDQAVRSTVSDLLRGLGYQVLTAPDAASALAIVDSGTRVDLLFTDVVMPGALTSSELARLARERLPHLAVVFTSGYAHRVIVHEGRLDAGVDLLPKPYTLEALARKLRQALTHQGVQP